MELHWRLHQYGETTSCVHLFLGLFSSETFNRWFLVRRILFSFNNSLVSSNLCKQYNISVWRKYVKYVSEKIPADTVGRRARLYVHLWHTVIKGPPELDSTILRNLNTVLHHQLPWMSPWPRLWENVAETSQKSPLRVVRKVDNAIHWINLYPVDSIFFF